MRAEKSALSHDDAPVVGHVTHSFPHPPTPPTPLSPTQAIGARLLVDAEPGERASRQRALVAQRAVLVARLTALEEELTAGL